MRLRQKEGVRDVHNRVGKQLAEIQNEHLWQNREEWKMLCHTTQPGENTNR
jgi:hypothetical protein